MVGTRLAVRVQHRLVAGMILPLRLLLALPILASLLSGCASRFNEASQDTSISTAADAPGFLIVGLSEENAPSRTFRTTHPLALALRREDGMTATMNRNGCGSMDGLHGSTPCDLAKLDWQVLQVQLGLRRPVVAAEAVNIFAGRQTLGATLPPGPLVRVGPGEVVCIGNYVLAADYDAPAIVVRRHGRDDAAAQRALAAYPGCGTRRSCIVTQRPWLPHGSSGASGRRRVRVLVPPLSGSCPWLCDHPCGCDVGDTAGEVVRPRLVGP